MVEGRGVKTGPVNRRVPEQFAEGRLAPQVGFEPTTLRLTAEQLLVTSRCKHKGQGREILIISKMGALWGTLEALRVHWLDGLV